MLFFVWIRFLTRKFWLSLTLSIFTTGILCFVSSVWNKKKNSKQKLKLKEKEDAENMFLSLVCQDNSIKFFENLAKTHHKNVIAKTHYITVDYPIEKSKTLLWFENSFSTLTIARFVEIYNKVKKEKANKIVICCKDADAKSLKPFFDNFNEKIIVLDQYETYKNLYKIYDFYPNITRKYSKERQKVFNDFIAYSFNKKRTKGYLFSAFILILSSLFVRETIYYCLISSILLIFALVSQFNPYFNQKSNQEIF